MADVSSRELETETDSVLTRVESGEDVTITVNGRPVATMQALGRRTRSMRRDDFLARFTGHQADAELSEDLAQLVPESD